MAVPRDERSEFFVVRAAGFEPTTFGSANRDAPPAVHGGQVYLHPPKLVGPIRFERTTSSSARMRSIQLSYGPTSLGGLLLNLKKPLCFVLQIGIEHEFDVRVVKRYARL